MHQTFAPAYAPGHFFALVFAVLPEFQLHTFDKVT
jgi:hypothetical protein